nr:glycosyltransferase [Anaerolineae bacterium]
MINNPLVSVIIPVYNQAHYLQRALDSVLAQIYRPVEIIVVDDGSTDNPRAICEQYGDRVRFIRQENQGVCTARNAGLQAATGELVQFLDSDDFVIPDKLNAQVALLVANPQVGIVNSGWWLTDQQGAVLECVTPWNEAPVLDLETWLFWKPVLPGAMLLRKAVVEAAGGFDPAFTQAEDVDLVLNMMLTGCEARWLKRPTVYYRQHALNTVKNSVGQAENMVRVLTKFFEQPQVPAPIAKIAPQIWYYTLLWNCANLYREGHTHEVKHYLKLAVNLNYKEAFQVVTDFLLQVHKAGDSEVIQYQPLYALLSDVFDKQTWAATIPLDTVVAGWISVMKFYARPDRGVSDSGAFSALHRLPARQVVKVLAALMIVDQHTMLAAEIRQLWQNFQDAGLILAQDHYEVITLYLTNASKAAFSRQWVQAIIFLGHAIKSSAHPNALPPWYRFFRSSLQYVFQRVQHRLRRIR